MTEQPKLGIRRLIVCIHRKITLNSTYATGRTLNELSARRRGTYLHNTHTNTKYETCMPSAIFEPGIPAVN